MKKFLILFIIVIGLTSIVFAQDEEEAEIAVNQAKHQAFSNYFGINIGGGAMKLNDGTIFTANFGISYDFYLFPWFSISSGILFHQELYQNQPTDSNRFVPEGNPFCFTIPIGVHFNMPNAEWLYTGINFAFNIPITNANSPSTQDAYTINDVFYSMPVHLGFDFINAGKGGSRLFFKITPTFYNGGVSVPVGFVWQIYNWRIYTPNVVVNIPDVEVNIPPLPTTTIIIINN